MVTSSLKQRTQGIHSSLVLSRTVLLKGRSQILPSGFTRQLGRHLHGTKASNIPLPPGHVSRAEFCRPKDFGDANNGQRHNGTTRISKRNKSGWEPDLS
jgi:hypothetical protein